MLACLARHMARGLDWGRIVEEVEAVYGAAVALTAASPQRRFTPATPRVSADRAS